MGESGCGKSTIGRSLIGLETPRSGSIVFNGQELTQVSGSQLQDVYKRQSGLFAVARVQKLASIPVLGTGKTDYKALKASCA